MKTKTTFIQLYSFPGFKARARFKCGVLGDPQARVVSLVRCQKKMFVQSAAMLPEAFMIAESTACVIWTAETCAYSLNSNTAGSIAGSVRR